MVDYINLVLREAPVIKEIFNRMAALEAAAANGAAGEPPPKSRRAFYRDQLLKGELTSGEILQQAQNYFPDKPVTRSDLHWYAGDLRREGHDIPTLSEYDEQVLKRRKKG